MLMKLHASNGYVVISNSLSTLLVIFFLSDLDKKKNKCIAVFDVCIIHHLLLFHAIIRFTQTIWAGEHYCSANIFPPKFILGTAVPRG